MQPTKPLILTTAEAAEFHRAGRVERITPIKPTASQRSWMPNGLPPNVVFSGCSYPWAQFDHPEGGPFTCMKMPHATGTACWVREGWMPPQERSFCPSPGERVETFNGELFYRADGVTVYEPWHSARSMPRWASRATARCAAVDVRLVDGVWMWVETWERTQK